MWCQVQQHEHTACALSLGLAAGLCFCPSHPARRALRAGAGLVKSGFDDGHALMLNARREGEPIVSPRPPCFWQA